MARATQSATSTCFNPCFIGCYSLTSFNGRSASVRKMFQSLFYWMLLSNSHFPRVRPCLWWFQSLFYWMLLSNFLPGTRLWINSRFQSLFYWMLLSNAILSAGDSPARSPGFNPCFIGCYSLTLLQDYRESTLDISSFNPCFIGCYSLIFQYFADIRALVCSFNPCFIGCYSLTTVP